MPILQAASNAVTGLAFTVTLEAYAVLGGAIVLLTVRFFAIKLKLENFEDYLVFIFDRIITFSSFYTLHFGSR